MSARISVARRADETLAIGFFFLLLPEKFRQFSRKSRRLHTLTFKITVMRVKRRLDFDNQMKPTGQLIQFSHRKCHSLIGPLYSKAALCSSTSRWRNLKSHIGHLFFEPRTRFSDITEHGRHLPTSGCKTVEPKVLLWEFTVKHKYAWSFILVTVQ